jgi:hypothetical protein
MLKGILVIGSEVRNGDLLNLERLSYEDGERMKRIRSDQPTHKSDINQLTNPIYSL